MMISELVLITIILSLVLYVLYLKKKVDFKVKRRIEEIKEDVRKDALKRSRATIKGQVAEQIVPFLEEFEYSPSDARFLGSPIDYIIFDGYTNNKEIEIVLSDVKTGNNAKLTGEQKKIKQAVEEGKVKWKTIRVDQD
ncbi:MAG: Holliday junction resolvase-like protein [Candidatus Aenigmatarchaeota archaeon]